MGSLTVFFLFICIVVTFASPISNSIEPLYNEEIKEVEHQVIEELTNSRIKRDVYEYSYSASSKSESSVNWSMKRTETGNRHVYIIGPGQNNANYVQIYNG